MFWELLEICYQMTFLLSEFIKCYDCFSSSIKFWFSEKTTESTMSDLYFKGNPNFQGILNWIIQILHYYCRKQHKNINNSQINEHNVVISLCPSLCLLRLALPLPSSKAEFFSSWTQYSANFKCHKWSFVPYIVSFSGLKMAFSKLSLAKYHCLHNKKPCLQYLQFTLFHVFNYCRTSLQIFLFYKFFCTNLSQVELRQSYTERFVTSSYKSEVIELIQSSKNRIIQILVQKVAMILQFTCSE